MSTAAQQLAQWLETTHPDVFDALFQHVQTRRSNAALYRARLQGFGQDDMSEVDISASAPSVDISTVDTSSLSIPAVDVAPGPDVTSALDAGTDSSGTGFLQSIGSGISTAASSVANFLTSSQGLSDLTKLGTAYFGLQNNKVNAALQTQVLQAQIARTQAGLSPSPVSYAMVNGQLTPVYSSGALPITSNGAIMAPGTMPPALVGAISAGSSRLVTLPDGSTAYTVPPSIVGSLSMSGFSGSFSEMLPWIMLIGGGLVLLSALKR